MNQKTLSKVAAEAIKVIVNKVPGDGSANLMKDVLDCQSYIQIERELKKSDA